MPVSDPLRRQHTCSRSAVDVCLPVSSNPPGLLQPMLQVSWPTVTAHTSPGRVNVQVQDTYPWGQFSRCQKPYTSFCSFTRDQSRLTYWSFIQRTVEKPHPLYKETDAAWLYQLHNLPGISGEYTRCFYSHLQDKWLQHWYTLVCYRFID